MSVAFCRRAEITLSLPLREISLVISFNGPSFSLLPPRPLPLQSRLPLLVWSLGPFGEWRKRGRDVERGRKEDGS